MERIHFSKNAAGNSDYDEAWLQRLIMDQPNLLPVDQIERIFADLIPICIELPTPSGYLDNLLVTPAGDVALVECKLWRNPEARREVVGQIIDYAKDLAAWTYERLEEAISLTKPLDGSVGKRPSLYESASAPGRIDEASFIDSVSRNLRRGRFLLLIVGDGIREGVESMTEFLQQYAGLHFTLAIVELALFKVPTGGYIAQPRVLAKTTNIERGIVTIHDGRIAIGPPAAAATAAMGAGTKTTITKERYLEKLERNSPLIAEKLNAFIEKLETYAVTPEFGIDSMILRWHDDTRNWNLGTIPSSGKVLTDWVSAQADGVGLVDVSRQYLRRLAALVPGAFVRETTKASGWYVKNLQIDDLLADEAHQQGWLQAIAEFQAAVTKSKGD
ncbi:MAG: hypothetical protein ABSB15_15660 [Bryobacteraceae bacterium]